MLSGYFLLLKITVVRILNNFLRYTEKESVEMKLRADFSKCRCDLESSIHFRKSELMDMIEAFNF